MLSRCDGAHQSGQLQIDQAERDLRRCDLHTQRQWPAAGDMLEQRLRSAIDALPVLDHAGGVL
jgi:hypothetical protein